jgi:hypothetical protein
MDAVRREAARRAGDEPQCLDAPAAIWYAGIKACFTMARMLQ